GYFAEGITAMTIDEARALFYRGEAAMHPAGPWFATSLVNENMHDFDVTVIPFPTVNPDMPYNMIGYVPGWGVYNFRDEKDVAVAAEFLNHLLKLENMRERAAA